MECLLQTLKFRLGLKKVDPRNKPYKLASIVAEIMEALRITHMRGETPFEMHMCRRPNPLLLNLALTKNQNNLIWDKADT